MNERDEYPFSPEEEPYIESAYIINDRVWRRTSVIEADINAGWPEGLEPKATDEPPTGGGDCRPEGYRGRNNHVTPAVGT